ncbi:MAG: hypothetical protein J3K34DRAFT_523032 [Monoraphidium minutum]|nr:MAG: hypothetical protein J3K34DRAFT_523032 [Monoraphidium minutum]
MRPNSKRYIRFTIDDEGLPMQVAAGGRPARPACGQRCARCLRFTGFCLVCSGTLFQAVAPWVLSVVEAVGVLLMYLLLVPHPPAPQPFEFGFRFNLEDVVVGSAVRAAVISGTYAYGMRRQYLRPYLYTAYAAGGAGLAYALAKGLRFAYSSAWPAQAAVIGVFGAFSWVHVLAARDAVAWARKRTALGLATFPWEPALQEGLLSGRSTPGTGGASDGGGGGGGDVPPEQLADPDSNFTPMGELWVHWKEALPPPGGGGGPRRGAAPGGGGGGGGEQGQAAGGGGDRGGGGGGRGEGQAAGGPAAGGGGGGGGGSGGDDPDAAAVVLIHSGGGGAFAWRNVMADLAARCGVRVVAFDRPGFGLTSRPPAPPPGGGAPDPYSPGAQALLALQLCGALGVRRALLVAHGDGCLVAVMAAAMAARQRGALGLGPRHASAGSARGSLSLPGGGRPSESTDLGRASSLGSSDADSLGAAARGGAAAFAAARRRLQQGGHAGGGGGGGAQGPAGGRSGTGSGAASLAASISFQSLLTPGDSGSHDAAAAALDRVGSAGSSGLDGASTPRQGHGQQQQQQQGGPLSRLSQPGAPEPCGSGGGAAPPQQQGRAAAAGDGDGGGGAAAAAAAPELQAMTPTGAPHCALAPQLWPRSAQLQPPPPAAGGSPWSPSGAPPQQPPHQRGGGGGSGGGFLVVGASEEPPSFDVEVVGVALLHPRLTGHVVSGFTRLLARAKLGRAMLRPLLRSEIGEVANRRAWHRPERCTRQVLDLYRRPLRAEGWDAALLAASAAADAPPRRSLSRDLPQLRAAPLLVATGAHDRVAGPVNTARLAATAGGRVGIVPGVGHLSHEEDPQALLALLAPFVSEVLAGGGGGGGGSGGGGGGEGGEDSRGGGGDTVDGAAAQASGL